ncbi:MAG: SRPBCC family protein [Acidobacteriota bacterium]
MRNGDRIFSVDHWVPRPRGEVFRFLSDPRNLARITPPWLRFRMVRQSTPEIGIGTVFTYRLRIRGVPILWKSRIKEWKENEFFIDIQVKGPYSHWNHMHMFEEKDGGTVIKDRVIYRVPFGWIGRMVAGRMVRSDLHRIFQYRRQVIEQLLNN